MFIKSLEATDSNMNLNTEILLSNYRPKDFGNAKIDLTVDGG